MYGIRKDIDLSGFRGELNQVCFGPYDLQIVCGSYILRICSAFEYHYEHKVAKGNAEIREGREVFLRAVGQDVIDVQIRDEHCLILYLSNGDKILAIEDKEQYECFSIQFPDGSADYI